MDDVTTGPPPAERREGEVVTNDGVRLRCTEAAVWGTTRPRPRFRAERRRVRPADRRAEQRPPPRDRTGRFFPPGTTEWVASLVPDARARVFSAAEGGSHLTFRENPALFNRVVAGFLDETVTGTGAGRPG
ncbi:alpha/beta fold hydrolase [Actinacidiphila glaucinigra]|uniref:alpha/beta fold hydrolase n=1 Tax=Actinacidiphila glaucinigra TaxID=235986 RepID=UPI003808FC8A